MAQFRQSGGINGLVRNGVASDHISVPIRGGVSRHYNRRSKAAHSSRKKISIGFCVFTLSLILSFSAFFYLSLPTKGGEINGHQAQDDDTSNDTDFLLNVTRMPNTQKLKFGHGSIVHGKDSRYWDKDDRRRDDDYSEEELERTRNASVDRIHSPVKNRDEKSSTFEKSHKALDRQANGLYNEAGRNELKTYEAEYEKSLKSTGDHVNAHGNINRQTGDTDEKKHKILDDADDYDDGIGLQDEDDDVSHNDMDQSGTTDKASNDLYKDESSSNSQHDEVIANSGHTSSDEGRSARKLLPGKRSHSKRKSKRRKFSGTCEMKMANSSSLLVEPLESRKFARFSLEYTKTEQKPIEDENWEPRFAGHQSLTEREESFVARDQKINCGFVRGPEGSPSTGFDLAEDDARYIDSCHIAVMSCIFGNSDHLRSPIGKTISRSSRKNVCFVMFVDELTIQTLSSEGQMPDPMGFIGFWKIVVVKNLPYTDMRRVGKIPKLLPHRLFPKARYSIWLDSKLRLQLDPILILEYFLWRKGHEYAISNHYDRHCLWEEVEQNKRLHKYNHTVIDEQFAFYQADGMKRFNASDPNKLLPSNVPEGSFIVRAHTPMSNLFSCLWFNEVERFTPRDQLSFAYTYHKLTRMNPEKPFYLSMFKDCERRKIAKLYRHRSVDTKSIPQHEAE